MSSFFDQQTAQPTKADLLWPLVILFGSYRGNGEEKLHEISSFLRENRIRAYTVSEYGPTVVPRREGEDNDEYNLRLSFWCTEHCDIAVFIFFRGITIGVKSALESLDQGPIFELAHICERPIVTKDLFFVFDSQSRRETTSSLFRGIVKKELYPSVTIEKESPDAVINEIKLETLGYCRERYAQYAMDTRVGPLKFNDLFR